MGLIKKYEGFKPFTDGEAWGMFRAAAIAESIGWTILILGILTEQYITPGNHAPVRVAGRIHGTLFLIYIAAAAALSPSMGWSLKRATAAGIASVPPYGSLIFEQWAAHRRRRDHIHKLTSLTAYYNLVSIT